MTRMATMALVCSVAFVVELRAQGASGPELELTEVKAVRLPERVSVLGGVLGPDGTVLLWGAGSIWLKPDGAAPFVEYCRGGLVAPRYVAYSARLRRYEVYDSASGHMYSMHPGQGCRREIVWATENRASLVVRTESEWVELSLTDATRAKFRAARHHARDTVVQLPQWRALRFGKSTDYVAWSSASAVLLTENTFPFRTLRVQATSEPTVISDPVSQLPADSRARLLAGWTSLRPVFVEHAMLQVLADPRSDERLLLVLDKHGRLLRTRALDVAIGLLCADSATRTLLAIRNVGGRELVYYRWRWRAEN